MDKFIPRKFKLISDYSVTKEDEDFDLSYSNNPFISFDDIIKDCNKISVILGEPASGKTTQLEEYEKNSENSSLLKAIEVDREKNKNEEILLFDSIDEALVKYPTIKDSLLNYIDKNTNKKFIITCRYLEWKEYFEKEFQELDENLKVYEIAPLTKEEISKLLPEDKVKEFWDFINRNYLESLLKNILVIKYIVETFENYNKATNYIEIYENIAKEYLSRVGKYREEQNKDISLNKQLLIASSLATYMTSDKRESIKADKITASKLYKIDNNVITLKDLESVLKTAIFNKIDNNFKFFHKAIQEYLTAYFINYKELDFDNIKQLFAHKLRFYEEFEEVIIYLTNIETRYFKYIVEFDPFIYRRHPNLTKEQQGKLFKSIIKNLIKNEKYFKDRQIFLNNTTLVILDKINPFEFLSKDDKNNILQSDNEILLFYISRVFSFHYSKDFEEFIFKILENHIKDKTFCSNLINYSYSKNEQFNLKLFNFMKKNDLFYINIQLNKALNPINMNREVNKNILKLFLQLKDKIEDIACLLQYIETEDFEKIVLHLYKSKEITIDNIIQIFEYFLDKKLKYNYNNNTIQNVAFLIYLLTIYNESLNKNMLINIDKIFIKYNAYNFFSRVNRISCPLFYTITDDFWELYFNNKIKKIHNFLEVYNITIEDIEIQKDKYPIGKYFFEYYNFYKLEDSINKLALSNQDKQYLINQYKENQDENLLEALLNIFSYDGSKIEAEFIFEIYQKFKNDIEKCRGYIKQTLSIDYDYNLKLFNFMKKNNLFLKEEKELISWFKESNEIENWIFNGLYGLWFKDSKVILNKNNYKQDNILFLFRYITYYHFFHLSKHIDINDIKDWFDYFCENYDKELFQDNGDYANSISWLAYKLLIEYYVDKSLLEKIIIFFKNTKSRVNFHPSKDELSWEDDESPKPLFYTIEDSFWDIYFSDIIESIEEIKNFIELYNIKRESLEEAKKRLNISDENKKYQEFKKYLYEKLPYKEKEEIEYKQNIKDRKYAKVYRYVLRYIKNNNGSIDFKEIDKKLKDDLKDEKYQEFLSQLRNYIIELRIDDIKDLLFERDIKINKYYSYLLSIVDINELNVDIKKIFWLVCLNIIVVNDNIKELIRNNFETFIKVAIEYNKLFFNSIYRDEKEKYLKRESPINLDIFNEKFVKLFREFIFKDELLSKNNEDYSIYANYIKNLDKLDFLLAKHFFLEILSRDKNSYDFIKNKMNYNKNDLTYYNYLARIDKYRAKKDLEDTYNYWIQYDAINFVNNLSFLMEALNKDINTVLNDFFEKVYNKISYDKKDEVEEEIEKYFKDEIEKNIDKKENSVTATIRPKRNNKDIDQNTKQDTIADIKQNIIEDFCKNKKFKEYNIIKIRLFDKLLNNGFYTRSGYNYLFSEYNIEKINEKNKKRILIDYYRFYNEDKIPTENNYMLSMLDNYTKTFKIILLIWRSLENLDSKDLLEELQTNKNKYIQNFANYILNKLEEKKERTLDLKKIFDRYKYSNNPLIITEGKTDWKHLKKALERFKQKGEYLNLDIDFFESENIEMGDSELVNMVRTYSKTAQVKKHIMIFDRDRINNKIIKKIYTEEPYQDHGNNVFSLFIPKINNELDKICIEFYYKEEEIKKAWHNDKRLFYGNEFDPETQISYCGKYETDKPKPTKLDILDGDKKKKVYRIEDKDFRENIALSKNNFANNVMNELEGFNNFNIDNFKLIFNVIEQIINEK